MQMRKTSATVPAVLAWLLALNTDDERIHRQAQKKI